MEKQSYSNYDIIGREFGPGGGKCTFRVSFRRSDPNIPIQGYGFSILPPPGNDWIVATQSREEVLFGNKKRSKPEHTFICGVFTRYIGDATFDSVDELARVATEKVSGKESGRFRNLEFEAQPTSVKGVGCMRIKAVAEERENPLFPAGTVLLQTNVFLVCPHPQNSKLAVITTQSERRPSGTPSILDDALKQEVESILATVVFTPFL